MKILLIFLILLQNGKSHYEDIYTEFNMPRHVNIIRFYKNKIKMNFNAENILNNSQK